MAFIQKAHLNRLYVWVVHFHGPVKWLVFLKIYGVLGRPLIKDYDCAKNDHGSKSLERIITILLLLIEVSM